MKTKGEEICRNKKIILLYVQQYDGTVYNNKGDCDINDLKMTQNIEEYTTNALTLHLQRVAIALDGSLIFKRYCRDGND